MKQKIFSIFLILSLSGLYAQNVIERSQYWFNNNFDVAVTENIAMPEETIAFSESISTAHLSDGLHTFHIRFQGNEYKWSSTLSSFFYKTETQEAMENNIAEYQYWLNNDFDDAVTATANNQQTFVMDENIDFSEITDGLHSFHIRFKDSTGKWSNTISNFLYKMPTRKITDNKITNYRYWFNDNFDEAVVVELNEPVNPFNLLSLMDLKLISAGDYEIHFQFRDKESKWSSVLSEEFTKIITPYAYFTVDNSEFCNDGTVQFSNHSVDSDTYHWDFDDGNSSVDIEPVHYFESPGEYNVTLTASDHESGKESTYSSVIYIYPEYEFVENHEICDSDVYSWHGQDYFEAGTYYAEYKTEYECDSVYILNLSIYDLPEVTINGLDETYCLNASPISMTGIPQGGIFNGAGVNDDIFDPGSAGIGTWEISYSFIDENNCKNNDTLIVTVEYCTGIAKQNSFLGSIYPNPTDGNFIIELDNIHTDVNIIITDIKGNTVYSGSFKEASVIEGALKSESAGVFFVIVNSNEGFNVFRLIKK